MQTNEVQRSWVLVPVFLRIAARTGADTFDLVELGSSAGLNLVWDRYRYRYAAAEWRREDAPLTLAGEERRAVPAALLALAPKVRGRVGIDRDPVDLTSDEGARLLHSFIWVGQDERHARLDRAIEALRSDPPQLLEGDFVEALPEVLAAQPLDGLTIVFQTAALDYVGGEGRARVLAALEVAAEQRPVAFVSAGRPRTGGSCWGVRTTYWPGRERELAAHADVHGRWLEWEL